MKMNQAFKVLSAALLLAFTVNTVSAQAPETGDRQRRNRDGGQNGDQQGGPGGDRQGRGNFDTAQFQKMRLDRIHEALEVKDDAEWTAIEPMFTKVLDAQRETLGGMRGMFGRGGRGGQGGGQGDRKSVV